MKHKFVPSDGLSENPGVWDNGNGGLTFVSECSCGVQRKKGTDYTGSRPGNNWGPHYYDIEGNRIPNAGQCHRELEDSDD